MIADYHLRIILGSRIDIQLHQIYSLKSPQKIFKF